jgi:hypothetical protein
MTASITRCSASSAAPGRRARRRGVLAELVLALCIALGLAAGAARADTIEVTSASLESADDNYALNANFEFEFSARLDEAVHKGLPLYFLIEFELTHPRWYWFDERTATRTQTIRISYHALTRQYRMSTGSLHQNFATFEEVVRILKRVRNWTVLEKAQVQRGQNYTAAVRMRLDVAQLPKPFQVSALTNREWTLASDWYRFGFAFAEPEREAR